MLGSISRGGIGIIQQPVVHDGEGIGPLKRGLAGQHFVEHDSQRVDVAAAVAALALDLFGRDVFGRAHHLGKLGERQPARAFLAGDAEVDQLDAVFGIDHDVFGLQVAMHDAVVVDVGERVGNAQSDLDGAFGRKLLLLDRGSGAAACRRPTP